MEYWWPFIGAFLMGGLAVGLGAMAITLLQVQRTQNAAPFLAKMAYWPLMAGFAYLIFSGLVIMIGLVDYHANRIMHPLVGLITNLAVTLLLIRRLGAAYQTPPGLISYPNPADVPYHRFWLLTPQEAAQHQPSLLNKRYALWKSLYRILFFFFVLFGCATVLQLQRVITWSLETL